MCNHRWRDVRDVKDEVLYYKCVRCHQTRPKENPPQ